MIRTVRSWAPVFLWTFGALMLLVLAGPIEGSIRSALVAYLGPVAIGIVGAFLGRGAVGLLGVMSGLVLANIVAIVAGLVPAPLESELAERIPYLVLFAGLAAIGYLVGSWLRATLARRRSATGLPGR